MNDYINIYSIPILIDDIEQVVTFAVYVDTILIKTLTKSFEDIR
jgi:hypothetical protein